MRTLGKTTAILITGLLTLGLSIPTATAAPSAETGVRVQAKAKKQWKNLNERLWLNDDVLLWGKRNSEIPGHFWMVVTGPYDGGWGSDHAPIGERFWMGGSLTVPRGCGRLRISLVGDSWGTPVPYYSANVIAKTRGNPTRTTSATVRMHESKTFMLKRVSGKKVTVKAAGNTTDMTQNSTMRVFMRLEGYCKK